ncbi:MAG: hypothetical protein WA853_13105, partial [Candidatus Acidiferrum sp.]
GTAEFVLVSTAHAGAVKDAVKSKPVINFIKGSFMAHLFLASTKLDEEPCLAVSEFGEGSKKEA